MGGVALGVHDIKVKVKVIHCFALNRFGCVKVPSLEPCFIQLFMEQ